MDIIPVAKQHPFLFCATCPDARTANTADVMVDGVLMCNLCCRDIAPVTRRRRRTAHVRASLPRGRSSVYRGQ